jgi:hypothetical protein
LSICLFVDLGIQPDAHRRLFVAPNMPSQAIIICAFVIAFLFFGLPHKAANRRRKELTRKGPAREHENASTKPD